MEKPARDVVILGAGFSKAVNDAFPVLAELAKCVVRHLEGSAAPSAEHLVDELRQVVAASQDTRTEEDLRPEVDFEGWLSRLAVEQPHLSEPENYERRALFARAATAIRQVLLDAENKAFVPTNGLPLWPSELIRLLDIRRATVITMNYDTIIERLAPTVIWPWAGTAVSAGYGRFDRLYPADLFRDLPPTTPKPPTEIDENPPGHGRPIPRLAPDTLRLIKLHGSLDWFASPNDSAGATLTRWEQAETATAHNPESPAGPPGRAPFLVPPDANKSPYFNNPLLREMWSQARRALERAEKVMLVGYSLPATDTTFGGLLADTLGGRDVPVTVVDKHPDQVARRLHTLNIGVDQANPYSGKSAVKSWIESLRDEQARSAVKCLRNLANRTDANQPIWYASISVMVPDNPGMEVLEYVAKGRLEDDTFVLDLLPPGQERVACQVSQFLPPSEATRVAADLGDGRCLMLDYHVTEPQRGGDVASITFLFLPSVEHLDNRS